MQDFYFNGHWLSEFGGRLTETPKIEVAKRQYAAIDIPGKNKSAYIDKKNYSNVEFERSIAIISRHNGLNARQIVSHLINWLARDGGYCKFKDTQHPGMFTTAYLTNLDQIIRELRFLTTTKLKFSREAFWYSDVGQNPKTYAGETVKAGVNIFNDSFILSKPIVKIEFTSKANEPNNLILSINGSEMICTPLIQTEYLTLDFENMESTCYSQDLSKAFYFPFDVDLGFKPGENLLKVRLASESANGIKSVTVVPNWRYL